MSEPKAVREVDIDALVREGLAITDNEDERRWEIVRRLHRSPTPLVVAAVRGLDRSDPRTMVFVSDVVAQLKYEANDPLRDEAFGWLKEALRRPDADAVCAAAIGLAHQAADEHESAYIELSAHPSPDVRYASAFGLYSLESLEAAEALGRLCLDISRDVRSWATFGLTSNLRTSEAIERALWQCTTDPDGEVRGEAILALTSRGLDTRETITREVSGDEISDLLLEAIRLNPLNEWCAPLRAWQSTHPDWFLTLHETVAACCWQRKHPAAVAAAPESQVLLDDMDWFYRPRLRLLDDTVHQVAFVTVDGHAVFVAFPLRAGDVVDSERNPQIRELDATESAGLVVVSNEAPGHATGVMGAGGDGAAAALAIAAVRASWGWDESPSLEVRVDEAAFTVTLRFDAAVREWRGRAVAR